MDGWVLNMIFCIIVAFGSFGWALWKTMDAEKKKKMLLLKKA